MLSKIVALQNKLDAIQKEKQALHVNYVITDVRKFYALCDLEGALKAQLNKALNEVERKHLREFGCEAGWQGKNESQRDVPSSELLQ